MDARKAYESAVAAGNAPSGAPQSEVMKRGSAVQVACRVLMKADKSLTYDAARNRVRRAISASVSRVDEKKSPDLYEESRAEALRRRALAAEAKQKTLEQELDQARRIREHAFKLATVTKARNWAAITRKPSGKRETPVLFTSDFQAGEVIKLSETRGVNAYNLEIFRQRYRTLIGVTVKLVKNHHEGADRIVYLRGGDAISGGIHDELKDTDDVPAPLQCIAVIEEETAGIAHLADEFGDVVVISVGGNHDRITHKPRAKEYMAHSYDTLIQYAIEANFKNDKRVKFVTDDSGDVLFSVHGYKMLLTHGDRIGSGGGQGFLGTAGPIVRGAKKVKAAYATEGHHVDMVLCGHYHTPLHVHNEVMCNGSIAGYSEYARARIRAAPHAPSQLLFFVHEQRGVTAVREIDVNNSPKRSKGAHVVR